MATTPTAPPASPPAAVATATKIVPADWTNTQRGKEGLERLAPLVVGTINRGLPRFMAGQAERLIRCALTACVATPSLLKCTPISIFAGVTAAGQLGLTIGGPTGEAYLIPFKGQAQLVVGYKGFLQLGHRTDKIARVTPVEVREKDEYAVVRGSQQKIIHVPFKGSNKAAGKVIAYYCIVALTNGGEDFEEFTVQDAIDFRDQYAAARDYAKGPWYAPPAADGDPHNDFNEMAKKTLIRRLFKRMPISPELQHAANLDEMAEVGIAQRMPETFLPEYNPTDTATEALEDKLDKKAEKKEEKKKEEKKADPGKSVIAQLLDQLDKERGDADFAPLWLKEKGYDDLGQVEMLSTPKQEKLADELRAKLKELEAEPVA